MPDRASLHALARRLDLDDLRLLAVVSQEGSYAKAARLEPLTTSAISKRMAELERVIGCPLLERGAWGVRPTLAGEAAVASWAEFTGALQQLLAVQRVLRPATEADLVLRVDDIGARWLVLDRLTLAEGASADGGIAIVHTPAPAMAQALPASGAHAAIWHEPAMPGRSPAQAGRAEPPFELCGMRRYRFSAEVLLAVVHATHAGAEQAALALDELAPDDCLLVGPGTGTVDRTPLPLRLRAVVATRPLWAASVGAMLDHLGRDAARRVVLLPASLRHRVAHHPQLRCLPLAGTDGRLAFGCALREDPWHGARLRQLEQLAQARFEPAEAVPAGSGTD
jgi:DNA-binding transcriptional LysR family regulator